MEQKTRHPKYLDLSAYELIYRFSVYTSFWNVYCVWSWSGNKTKNSALILHKHLNKPAFTWPVFKKLIFQRILASNLLRIKIYKTEGHCGKGVSQQCLIFWSIKSALQKTSKNIKKENIYHLHIILACSCKPWLLWDYVKPTLFSAVTDCRPYDTELIKFKFLVCSQNTDGNSIPGGEDISHKSPHISPCSRNARHCSIQQYFISNRLQVWSWLLKSWCGFEWFIK